MIKTNKKNLSYKKKLKKTRKNLSYKKKLKKSRKNMKKNRKFFGGDPEHEIPFLLKQAFENSSRNYLPDELLEMILKDVPKESIKKAITMADYKKSLAERKQKIETLKKIYPELLKKYKELIEENKIQFQKMDSIMRSGRMSNDVRQNTNKFYKFSDQVRRLQSNMFRLNEISKDFEKIKNKDLDYFLGLQDDESYLTPKPYVKFP